MMGSFLSKESPTQPDISSKELRRRYKRPNPLVQTPHKRLSFGEHLASANRFAATPRRRYPIQQLQYSIPGTLPTVRWDGYQKKNVLSSRNSTMVHSPVTVKIARPDASIIRSPLFAHMMLSPVLPPLTDPCSKETVLSALKESRKRMVDEGERILISEQENKRRRHDSSGSGQSAFEPLLANGAPASLVPKPGTLKRGTNSQCSDDPVSKRSRTSSISSLNSMYVGGTLTSARNPIFSSYSSTRGHTQGLKHYLSVRNASPLSSPGSSRSQTPERPGKKSREEEVQRSNASTPVRVDKAERDQPVEEEMASPLSKQSTSTVDSPTSEGDGKRKRKVPLLSKRKGDQLTLPPPPQLGYTITVDDLDSEKKAGLDRIKKVLEEKEEPSKAPAAVTTVTPLPTTVFTAPIITTSAPPTTTATSAPVTISGPVAFSSPVTFSSPVAISSPLLDTLKKMQKPSSLAATSESVAGVTLTSAANAAKVSEPCFTTTTMGQMPTPPPAYSAATKPIPTLNFSSPLISQPLVNLVNQSPAPPTITSNSMSQISTPAPTQETVVSKSPETNITVCARSVAPSSTSFGLTSALTSMATATSTPTLSSVPASEFKLVFSQPTTAQTSTASPALNSRVPLTSLVSSVGTITSPGSATSSMAFKPVFGKSVPPASSSSPFTFSQSSPATLSNETAALTTSVTSHSTTTFPFGSFNSLAGSKTDSEAKSSKGTFSFGLSVPLSTKPSAVSSASNNLAAQPFQFGPNPTKPITTATNAEPSAMFQFGNTSADPVPSSAAPPAPTFGQPKVAAKDSAVSTPATSKMFGGFGATVSAPSTTSASQLPLSFGNSSKASLFGSTTGTATQSFGGQSAQLQFGNSGAPPPFGVNAVTAQQTPTKASAFANTSTPFNFGASPVQPAFPSTTAPSTFGSASQFGETPTVAAQAGFGTNSTQQTFGSTTAGFSFDTNTSSTTTSSSLFGNTTKSSASGAPASIFGSSSQLPLFGSSSQPTVTNPNTATQAGFNFGAGQGGFSSSSTLVPFAASTSTASSQNMFASPLTSHGPTNQATPQFNFGGSITTDNKPAFGGSNAPGFGQNTPTSGFSFGNPGTPVTNFGNPVAGAAAVAAATPGLPTFSIGSGPRPTGARQRLQARRQHQRKR
ncbi:nuclear envelope pore membrane protein POM 121 isoform X2 [Callorhinchus milii]|nr:nuclear envelope pore membrane protein POM 121 isoform X2 [Callorhinchus milii]|eukprot:gi/632957700/ref/XP_007894629.1/ PREDICTED: nuclear envelope pore membrane protein POM 121C-like isoform X2 [Callorhinchus milii]